MKGIRFISLICCISAISACTAHKAPTTDVASILEKMVTMDGKVVQPEIYGVHLLYPDTAPAAAPAPKGYTPCHLSHYGRHGARYIQYDTQYFFVHDVLEKAFAADKLTETGKQLRDEYKSFYNRIERHSGELCPLGLVEHRQIAARMTSNYPELFKGNARIEANSTNLERTMLSMWACLDELHAINPELEIIPDGARVEMEALNPHCPENTWGTSFDQMWKGTKAVWRQDFLTHSEQWIDWKTFGDRIFTDLDWAQSICKVVNFEKDVYLIAADVPCMGLEGVNLFKYFTEDELLPLAKCGDNYLSYMEKSHSPQCPGRDWALCHTLLENFIARADQDLKDGLGVRLRFGHDGCMMGMFVMMDLPGWNAPASNPDEMWEVWDCSRIPMASNLQMVLYRGRNAEDPILMTWRLNEEPMALPLEEVAPGFYRWEDFKAEYLPKIEQCKELLRQTAGLTPENFKYVPIKK